MESESTGQRASEPAEAESVKTAVCSICRHVFLTDKRRQHCLKCSRDLANISYGRKVLVTTHFNENGKAICGTSSPRWRLVTQDVTCAKCILVRRIRNSNENPQPHPCAAVQQQQGGEPVNRDGNRIVVTPRNEGRRVNRLPSAETSHGRKRASERAGVA